MSEERVLFDRKLLRARRARFAHEIESHQFLLEHVGREIAESRDGSCRFFRHGSCNIGSDRGWRYHGRKVRYWGCDIRSYCQQYYHCGESREWFCYIWCDS